MLALMKTQITNGLAEINLCVQVPEPEALTAETTLRGLLTGAGHDVISEDDVDYGDEGVSYTAAEVFPDGCPAMALRGLRGREGLAREEMAARLGLAPAALAQLESGQRPISEALARRIGKTFGLPAGLFRPRPDAR